MKICLVGAKLLHADEQVDSETGRTKLIVAIHNFAKRLERDAQQTVDIFWLNGTSRCAFCRTEVILNM